MNKINLLNLALKKIFGSANERLLKHYRKFADKINSLESKYVALSDEELKNQTELFKERLERGETLDDIKCEAFAVVREAAKRTLKQRPFDVQLIGGLTLHDGRIAEMKTGEGKTLTATMPVYLNALSGKGVHIVTVNDYLAKRDAHEMGAVYKFLGLTVGYIIHGLTDEERRDAYHCDVTYGTNHEFGFDYLRDNMKFHINEMVMRPFNYAIVDEVDSILIDEARTPLIISGPAEQSSDLYAKVDEVIATLKPEHYEKDEKNRNVTFTDNGVEYIESELRSKELLLGKNLYDLKNVTLLHYVNASLRAHTMFKRDIDYIVKGGEVIIIDEFTGRMMEGRRYSDGLHQAIEAKEHVEIQLENQTLASITYQNYFRMYPKLSGMSGTVMTEAEEFEEIYKLQSVEIPTNVKVVRTDHDDEFYVTADEKYAAMMELLKDCQRRGQPVLVGTTSIQKSEHIAMLMQKNGIKHSVLNARFHEQEAYIIANAGRLGSVTIATNMAGRGTDIKLGGNVQARFQAECGDTCNLPETDEEKRLLLEKIRKEVEEEKKQVLMAGGLYVIGTERHESRRVDNQLRGRSGRQGDPGATKFFLSVEDELLVIFGFDQKKDAFRRKLKPGEKMSHGWLNRIIQGAQRKVEARNFDMRKNLLRYDDVMSDQRIIIYKQRKEFMEVEDVSLLIHDLRETKIEELLEYYVPAHHNPEDWDIEGLKLELHKIFSLDFPLKSWIEKEDVSRDLLKQKIEEKLTQFFEERYTKMSKEIFAYLEKNTLLKILDHHWKAHLYYLDQLRQGINLRAYGQSNPLNEYKREAFQAFENMLTNLRSEMLEIISHMPVDQQPGSLIDEDNLYAGSISNELDDLSFEVPGIDESLNKMRLFDQPEIGIKRNDPCPCGSGKRYKNCHGAAVEQSLDK